MVQAGVVPVTWLSLASQYQGSYTSHQTVRGFLGLMAQHSPALGMLFQGQAARQAAPGGTTGTAHVYNSRTGALVAQYQFGPNGKSLINDVVLTVRGAYFTDSYNPDIYEIPIGPSGRLGRAVTIPLSGAVAAFSTAGLNLNGIAATADGNTLIVDNTVLDKLFTVNPATGASAPINVAGRIPSSMDGLLLQGSSLWVVENTANTVIRVTLSHDLSSGTITSTITSPLFDDPATVAKYGDELALPNGRYNLGLPPPFGPGAPPGTTFNVVVVPAY